MTNYFFKGIKEGMKEFGQNITIIVNSILLSIVYLIGVGPTSIIAKIFGKSFLQKELVKETYWTDLNLEKEDKDNYYRQF
jgi:hypothetical protein